ncbi:MAG: M48 family metallopeptidase [Bacteroidaceae bacterium]|nr:M48 family metallopeptidase [Bacteroidaceae bacterium]
MKAKDIMHPDDAKALQILKKVKGLDGVVRLFMENGYEQLFRGENLGCMLKVNAHNFPSVWKIFRAVVRKVGIREPELYIYNDPIMNAYTYGETHTFIALSSSLVERLNPEELKSIIAHECDHILCKHTLYQTLLDTIEDLGFLAGILTYSVAGPLYLAMQYWSRKSELSADRCAAAIVGERTFQSAMLKLTCGIAATGGDPYQLVRQAQEYHRMENSSWWNRIQQNCRIALYTHPQMCERAWEIDRWKESWQYRRLRQS